MKPYLICIGCAGAIAFLCLLGYFAHQGGVPLVAPSGLIALAERNLMARALFLMLIVVIPLFILIGFIAWRYRAGNRHAKYTPDWERSNMEEFIWWSIPFEIVLVLSALTWSGTHALAPERALSSSAQPYVVQVVALPWKWLFIYPEDGVASVNELAIPAGRPVEFQITADAPMNSFWIPALGGQMYAMSGMTTELHLMADAPGDFTGMSANYSGEGFAKMNFTVHALDDAGFQSWVAGAKEASSTLDHAAYAALAAPSDAGPVRYYSSVPFPFMAIVHTSMGMNASSTSMDMNGMPMTMPMQ